jgi:polyhydroxyalkanoate synthesis regulator protein
MTDKQQAALEGPGPISIVRYGNRKLYVPNLGYVELPFLQECVRRSRPLAVRNHMTGADETGLILSRMLVEAAKDNKAPVAQLQRVLEGIYGEPASAG